MAQPSKWIVKPWHATPARVTRCPGAGMRDPPDAPIGTVLTAQSSSRVLRGNALRRPCEWHDRCHARGHHLALADRRPVGRAELDGGPSMRATLRAPLILLLAVGALSGCSRNQLPSSLTSSGTSTDQAQVMTQLTQQSGIIEDGISNDPTEVT